ncbi:MAG TPA: hypothetical protein VGC98_01255 [Thermoleophilaceae bacterium]
MKRAAIAAAMAALALFAADARAVAPGFDLFQTDPEQNVFKFVGKSAIPAGFFTPDSQPFEGSVNFGGNPLITFQGQGVGNADTVVERTAAATPGPGSTAGDPAPIELRALSLLGIAPIEVVTGQTTQRWDVRASLSPSRPSSGSIRLTQSDPNGGTLDSQITVYPIFTFTRVSDGATRVLDVGALPDGSRPDDPVFGQATPWRAGCVAPALSVPALNPGFCAGQLPAGGTTLTIEQGVNLQHGIRPASARLEHFACYTAPSGKGFKKRSVTLTDQFASRTASVQKGTFLCNPARKGSEPGVVNKHDHLRCYQTDRGADVGATVLLRNQFGPFQADVHRPNALCVPSTKQVVRKGHKPPKPPKQSFKTDHFQCYSIKPSGDFTARTVLIRDQFGKRKLAVGRPFELCAPTTKNRTPVRDPVEHLVCYRALPAKKVAKRVSVHNQFGGELTSTKRVDQICLPSIKAIRKL